jgi:hypothetical protein
MRHTPLRKDAHTKSAPLLRVRDVPVWAGLYDGSSVTDNAARTAQGIAPGARAVALTIILGLAPGCVSVGVEPLTQQHYPPRNGNEPVQVLSTEPFRPSMKLARIVATSQTVDEDALRERILTRARQLGADAVILGKVDVLESRGPSPLYESTLSPAGTGYGSYVWGPWGWWDPFYLDPWSCVQGAADQREWTTYLSGIAIRYEQSERTGDQHDNDRRNNDRETKNKKVGGAQ